MMEKIPFNHFDDLTAIETKNQDFRIINIDRQSLTLILAPHGGGIEPGTSEIAKEIARDQFSDYLFEGLKPTEGENWILHITSTEFDEPQALDAVRQANTVITIHGIKGNEEFVMIGGRDKDLKDRISSQLEGSGFDIRAPRKDVTAEDVNNICNCGNSEKGVQLEISRTLREKLTGEEKSLQDFTRAIHNALDNRNQ